MVLATFSLKGFQWHNFDKFFEENPKGILKKEIINVPRSAQELDPDNDIDMGHAVIIVSYNKNYLRIMNSCGTDWGDDGFFKIENEDVLRSELWQMKFFDVYWTLDMLTP